jgi:hypothetical protein
MKNINNQIIIVNKFDIIKKSGKKYWSKKFHVPLHIIIMAISKVKIFVL